MTIRLFVRTFLYLGILLWVFPAFAVHFPEKPESQNFYVDKAEIITPEDRYFINTITRALLNDKKIPLFVVTIPSLEAYQAGAVSLEEYARQLFDSWGIGFPEWNYGILLLISEQDRKARIEFGKDWNHRYDREAEFIMQNHILPEFQKNNYMLPEFHKNNYSSGIKAGVKELNSLSRGLGITPARISTQELIIAGIASVIVLAIIVSLFRQGKAGWGFALLLGIIALLMYLGRFGGKGDGSNGFGGGSSGGGGASGSW